MSRPRRNPETAPPVTNAEAAVVIGGWGANPPHGDPRDVGLWLWEDDQICVAWRTHEAYLRALAREWGWLPKYWIAPRNEYGLRFVMEGRGERKDAPLYYYAEALEIAAAQRMGTLSVPQQGWKQ